ncbi:MAG: hypothetical protein K0S49_9 [Microbacterium sp.]|jgi:hypothetical protein|nr:hypothetical protein [Microbacterium sp.]
MTITTYGYAGEVDEIAYAESNIYGGVRYGVAGFADFRPTAGTGDRGVSIAAGTAIGGGVRAVNDAPVNLNLASVGSGSRWDLIVLRRDWGAGTATLVVIEGSSTKALPARNADVGDVDDQPIALCRVAAGSSAVAEIVDLRVFPGDGGAHARDILVLSFMDRLGTMLRIGSSLWSRELDAAGAEAWVDLFAASGYTPITHLATAENGGGVYLFGYLAQRGGVVLRGVVQKKTGAWSGGTQIAALPAAARPGQTVRVLAPTSVAGQAAKVRITPAGAVFFDETIDDGTSAGPVWIQFDGVFIPR